MLKTYSSIYLWIIEESKWSIIRGKKVSNNFIVYLHCREFKCKFSVIILKKFGK